jgi:ribonuclease I
MCLKNKKSLCLENFKNIEKFHLSIHGLWPGLSSGQMLEECNNGAQIEVVNDGSDTFKTLEKIWPSLSGSNEDFWTHEYNKHGYCYNKRFQFDVENYKIFFDKTVELYYKLNF